jgi:hypothetical protein
MIELIKGMTNIMKKISLNLLGYRTSFRSTITTILSVLLLNYFSLKPTWNELNPENFLKDGGIL